ncbi:MAG TPA: caspase family protein [Thermoanaerobaculia bacterium]|nr:caspase family protein [Thermoanaerobaculia bacterium]
MSALHALLIGINDYFPDRLPNGCPYSSLHGADDVSRMGLLLQERAGLQPETTRLLLSRAGEDGAPTGLPEQRPTYANIVAAFKQLAFEANPGDRVYIHYSGHGSRGPTQYPGVKGLAGKDEALVPCDIFTPESRYLTDLELAFLVQLLVERDLLVTVVLDCCHAGGAMRGRGKEAAVPRQVPWVRRAPVPSAVGDLETLTKVWKSLRPDQRAYRGLKLQSSLPVEGYSLFAACRPDETAFEYPFEGGEPQGALTYWLIDTLRRSDGELKCGEIHERLKARIRGSFAKQTPMFIGDSERGFLAPERKARTRDFAPASPRVLRVAGDGRVLIDVGVATGAKVGDRVHLKGWPSGDVSAELAICQVGSTESWAEVTRVLEPGAIEPGARAEVLRLQTAVRLIPPEQESSEAERALARLREALRVAERGFVEICENGSPPDLCVTVDENGAYEIQDPGGEPIPNLSPLRANVPGAALKLMRRLDHMARFRNILAVENPDHPQWLEIGLEVLEEDGEKKPVPLSSRVLDLQAGEPLTLRIVNRSSLRLDFTVLYLAPDYSVTQFLPKKGTLSLLPLDPQQAEVVPLRGWLPPGYTEGNDVLKIFATKGAASFRWLELPKLDGIMSNFRGEPKNPLERLFAQLAARRPAKRGPLTISEFPEEEWITAQVEIRVRR